MKSKKKILIIDDEPDILEFLSYNFKKNNFEINIACNGIIGIENIKTDKPDLIISDILMPDMDGIEMCREIRTDKAISEIPIILLTAVNDDYKVLYAMTSGADQFVSKPIRFEYLLGIVRRTLKNE